MNKDLPTLLILTLFVGNVFTQDYSVECDAEKWEGNSLDTTDTSLDIERTENGISLPRMKFKFSLPAKFGDTVEISEDDKPISGMITYFYDHTKWLADESYIVLISKPQQIMETWVIQIESGWTHYSFTKNYGGFGEDILSTQTFAKKCSLKMI